MAGLIALIVVAVGFTAYCLVDLACARAVRCLSREVWVVICLVSIPLGGIIYMMAGKAWKVRGLPGSASRWPMWRSHYDRREEDGRGPGGCSLSGWAKRRQT